MRAGSAWCLCLMAAIPSIANCRFLQVFSCTDFSMHKHPLSPFDKCSLVARCCSLIITSRLFSHANTCSVPDCVSPKSPMGLRQGRRCPTPAHPATAYLVVYYPCYTCSSHYEEKSHNARGFWDQLLYMTQASLCFNIRPPQLKFN